MYVSLFVAPLFLVLFFPASQLLFAHSALADSLDSIGQSNNSCPERTKRRDKTDKSRRSKPTTRLSALGRSIALTTTCSLPPYPRHANASHTNEQTTDESMARTGEEAAAAAAPADDSAAVTAAASRKRRGGGKGCMFNKADHPLTYFEWALAMHDDEACGWTLGRAADRYTGMTKGWEKGSAEMKNALDRWKQMNKGEMQRTKARKKALVAIEEHLQDLMKAGTIQTELSSDEQRRVVRRLAEDGSRVARDAINIIDAASGAAAGAAAGRGGLAAGSANTAVGTNNTDADVGSNNAGVSNAGADANTNDADADDANATKRSCRAATAMTEAADSASSGAKRKLAAARAGAAAGDRTGIGGGTAATSGTPQPKRRAPRPRPDAEEEDKENENGAAAAAASGEAPAVKGGGDDEEDEDGLPPFGTKGTTFLLSLDDDVLGRVNNLLKVLQTKEGLEQVRNAGEINGSAYALHVSPGEGDDGKNKNSVYEGLAELFPDAVIPRKEFEAAILDAVLRSCGGLLDSDVDWDIGGLDLLVGMGEQREPQPIHADCSNRHNQYFGSIIFTPNAEGTVSCDQSDVRICSSAAQLRDHARGWGEASEQLIKTLDENPETAKLLRGYAQILSGGTLSDPGIVPQLFTTLLGGAHPHGGPASKTEGRVVLFFTIFPKGMADPYDGSQQYSTEMLVMSLYEEVMGDLEGGDRKYLLEKFLKCFVESAKRGARDKQLDLPRKWHAKINALVAAVEKYATDERRVGVCKTQLAEMQDRARKELRKGGEEHVALSSKALGSMSEVDGLQEKLEAMRVSNVSALQEVTAAMNKLKEAIEQENHAFLELDAIRNKTLSFMLKDDLE